MVQDFGASLTPLKDPAKSLQEQLDAAMKEIESLKRQTASPSSTVTPPPNSRVSKTPPSAGSGGGGGGGSPGDEGGSNAIWLNSSINILF